MTRIIENATEFSKNKWSCISNILLVYRWGFFFFFPFNKTNEIDKVIKGLIPFFIEFKFAKRRYLEHID